MLNNSKRWTLTLFVSLVLILQSAGASLALCKLGLEESGCCGAHATASVPSCCSSRAELPETPREGTGARESDCTCELFGLLPKLTSESDSESPRLLLEAGHWISLRALCAQESPHTTTDLCARPLPPPQETPLRSSAELCAELMSWRL